MQQGTHRFHLGHVDVSIRVLNYSVGDEEGMSMSPWARIVPWSSWMLRVEVTRALLEGILLLLSLCFYNIDNLFLQSATQGVSGEAFQCVDIVSHRHPTS